MQGCTERHLLAWETSMDNLWLERFQSRCWTCEIFAASFDWQADSSVLANRFCVFSMQTLFLARPPQDILVCVSCAASLRCWSPSAGCSNLVVGSTWVASSCPSNWPGPSPSIRARWASGKCAPCFLSVCYTAAAAWCKKSFLITDDESSAAVSIQLARLYSMSCLLKGKSGLKQASAHPTLFTLGWHQCRWVFIFTNLLGLLIILCFSVSILSSLHLSAWC